MQIFLKLFKMMEKFDIMQKIEDYLRILGEDIKRLID